MKWEGKRMSGGILHLRKSNLQYIDNYACDRKKYDNV